ncbi:hypothetical protein V6N11_034862 [Hibiscus sabdariffa]|uniref:Uncharacterized protein n=1 Tax=Hibiscus sabdariffa TaxID=183260 RepID=A0ABR2AH27_9ROSI
MMMGMGMWMEVEGKEPDCKAYFIKDIQVGKTIPDNFPHLKESDPTRNLPRKTRTSLPPLPLLHPPASPQALAMEKTITTCVFLV